MNHIGFVTGLSVAFWLVILTSCGHNMPETNIYDPRRVGYGMSHWTYGNGFNLSWRLSILLQFIPALILSVGLPFVPER